MKMTNQDRRWLHESDILTLTIMSLVSKTCNKGTDMITHLITDLYLLKLMIKLRIVHVTGIYDHVYKSIIQHFILTVNHKVMYD